MTSIAKAHIPWQISLFHVEHLEASCLEMPSGKCRSIVSDSIEMEKYSCPLIRPYKGGHLSMLNLDRERYHIVLTVFRRFSPRSPTQWLSILLAETKGGVGKTTMLVSLAGELSKRGRRAHGDLDPQGHATLWLRARVTAPNRRRLCQSPGLASMYRQKQASGIDVLPGGALLS